MRGASPEQRDRLTHVDTALLSVAALHLAFWLVWATHYGDEGWYLYAARMLWAGRLPYRDFVFTQTPLCLFLYAPLQAAFPGVTSGRLTTAGVAFAAIFLPLALASRGAGRKARLVALALLASSSYFVYYMVIVKAYALAAGLLLGAALLLTRAKSTRAWIVAGVLVGLAALARISAAAALAGLLLYGALARQWRRSLAGALVGGAVFSLPMAFVYYSHASAVLFGLFAYHQLGILAHSLTDCLLRAAQRYVTFVLMAAVVLWCGVRSQQRRRWLAWLRHCPAMWMGASVLSAHLISPTKQPEYQVMLLPLFAVVIGQGWTLALRELRGTPRGLARRALVGVLGLAILAGFPLFHQNRFWPARGEPPWRGVAAGRALARLTAPQDPVLTLCPEVALSAQRPLRPGLEPGQFSVHSQGHHIQPASGLLSPAQLALMFDEPRGVLVLHSTARPDLAELPGLTETDARWLLQRCKAAVQTRWRRVQTIAIPGKGARWCIFLPAHAAARAGP